jgi:hypothetical protein
LTASAAATNLIDLGEGLENLNFGSAEIWLNVKVGTILDSSGDAATLTVALVNDTVPPIDGSSIVVFQTAAIAEATLVAGYDVVRTRIPLDSDSLRYLGIYYTVGTENFTTGTIDAWLEFSTQTDHPSQKTQSNIT